MSLSMQNRHDILAIETYRNHIMRWLLGELGLSEQARQGNAWNDFTSVVGEHGRTIDRKLDSSGLEILLAVDGGKLQEFALKQNGQRCSLLECDLQDVEKSASLGRTTQLAHNAVKVVAPQALESRIQPVRNCAQPIRARRLVTR